MYELKNPPKPTPVGRKIVTAKNVIYGHSLKTDAMQFIAKSQGVAHFCKEFGISLDADKIKAYTLDVEALKTAYIARMLEQSGNPKAMLKTMLEERAAAEFDSMAESFRVAVPSRAIGFVKYEGGALILDADAIEKATTSYLAPDDYAAYDLHRYAAAVLQELLGDTIKRKIDLLSQYFQVDEDGHISPQIPDTVVAPYPPQGVPYVPKD